MSELEKTNDLALRIEDLSVEFHSREHTVYAVNHLSLELKKGETLGLVGETGAGKTTTGLAVMDLISTPPGIITSGTIRLGDRYVFKDMDEARKEKTRASWKKKKTRYHYLVDICMTEAELEDMRGKEVSMIYQDPMTSLNPVMKVEDQIAEVIEKHEKLGKAGSVEKARDMLEMVGIPRDRGSEYPHQFSGGMKQRVVIAMALACKPDLLIADEPTTALDVTIQAQVLDMMKSLREKNRSSMLLITHDLGIVADICDSVAVIYAGSVVEYGSLEDIFDHTLHPYTKGLFDSLPNLEDRSKRLKPIPGLMPDPSIRYEGCPFAERCVYAQEICRQKKPAALHRTEQHYVVCHLYNEENIRTGEVLNRE